MSLLKQLLVSVTIIMGLILVGSTMVSVDAVRQYLNGQLQSQSDNAASVLALLLSQPANQDVAIRDTLVTALFDSGQFREIRLKSPDGAVLFERLLTPVEDRTPAPAWFRQLLPLKPTMAIRDVTNGWKQVGVLSVVADDASADDVLWRGSIRLLALILAVGVAWALVVALLVKWFKSALSREIRSQLDELDDDVGVRRASGTFPVTELNDISRAIEDARTRVQARGQAMAQRIDILETEVNHDPITGLPNRKYFMDRMQGETRKAQADVGGFAGYILLVRQRDLGRINWVMTRAEVDQWLRTVGQSMLHAMGDGHDAEPALLARLNGSDFVLLIRSADHVAALTTAHNVRRALDQLRVRIEDGSLCRWVYALAGYRPDADISALLSSLDLGLMRAESIDHDAIEVVEQDNVPVNALTGETQWHRILSKALATEGFILSLQSCRYDNGSDVVSRYEASLAIIDQGNVDAFLPASLFMPPAVRLGLAHQCHLRAVQLGLEWLAQRDEGQLVIRVALPHMVHEGFATGLDSLLALLVQHRQVAKRLILEIGAEELGVYRSESQVFCERVTDAGAQVGIRSLEQSPEILVFAHELKVSCFKVGGNLVVDLTESVGSLRLLSAIVETARGLAVEVFAIDVPDDETNRLLKSQGVYAFVEAAAAGVQQSAAEN